MARGGRFFIAGTDTDVGKTAVAAGLLAAAGAKGLKTAAIKPVAAGCEPTESGLRNGDALELMAAMNAELPYEQVNPVALEPAIAPHIAAQQQGKALQASRLVGFCRGLAMSSYDMMLVEGAGGWRVPLNSRETLADLARELNYPVILVVGVRLGCISHALLTAEAIARDGLPLAGWVANCCDPDMPVYQENIDSLKSRLRAPLLGEIPRLEEASAESVAGYLDIAPLGF